MDYAIATMLGSYTDVIVIWAAVLGVILGAILALVWITTDG